MKLQHLFYVLLATMFWVALLNIAPACCGQPKHHSEILRVEAELKAECIAILLREVPRKSWRVTAIELKDDPQTCQRAMDHNPRTLPMRGDNWLDRLDVGREVMEPSP